MLSIETLYKKKRFVKPNGEALVDLTKSTLEYLYDPRYKSFVTVTEDFVMRPDLIARATLGNDNKLDYILKFNGVSNPFSIELGEILIVPDDKEMSDQFKNPTVDKNDAVVKRTSDFTIEPKTAKDVKRLDALKQKTNKDVLFPPNVKKPSDTNIKYKDGKIIFGEDVTTINKENCPETLSRARVKEKLLNKKIFQ